MFFLVGSVLLLILTIINGAGTSSVLGNSIGQKPIHPALLGYNKTRWTFYRMCGVDHNKNAHCGKSQAAFPYSPEDNFGRNSGIPQNFIDDRDTIIIYPELDGHLYLLDYSFVKWLLHH